MKARWLMAGAVAVSLASVVGMAGDQREDETKTRRAHPARPRTRRRFAVSSIASPGRSCRRRPRLARLHTPDAPLIDLGVGEVAEGVRRSSVNTPACSTTIPGQRSRSRLTIYAWLAPRRRSKKGRHGSFRKTGHADCQPLFRQSMSSTTASGCCAPPESPGEMSTQDRLRELEWMLGEWVDESGDSVIRSTCRWTGDKHSCASSRSGPAAGSS